MLAARTLSRLPGVAILDVLCRAPRGGVGVEEASAAVEIVLPRRGAFVLHRRRRETFADANYALLFRQGEGYRVSHPLAGGDACTVLLLEASFLAEAQAPFRDAPPSGSLDRVATSARVDLLHRELFRRLRSGSAPIGTQEVVLEIVRSLLESLRTSAPSGNAPRRASTERRHADAARRACVELATDLGDKLDLFELARRIGVSPFQLCRIFRVQTGLTLRRYHERLRLRAALQRVLEGERDLGALALELGFSHHSHFTNRFRREFGSSPSARRPKSDARE